MFFTDLNYGLYYHTQRFYVSSCVKLLILSHIENHRNFQNKTITYLDLKQFTMPLKFFVGFLNTETVNVLTLWECIDGWMDTVTLQ